MAANKRINVEVVYASEHSQKLIALEVDEGTTIETVIRRSGILSYFPEIDLARQSVGVFSRQRSLTDSVHAGDRVEIYRPLLIDPKEARRARAKKR